MTRLRPTRLSRTVPAPAGTHRPVFIVAPATRRRRALAWAGTVVCLAFPLLACAASNADDLQARNRAASCLTCHAAGTLPPLAGRPQADIVAAMRAFRDGSRASTVMQQIARGYSDTQVSAIAAWFAAVPVPTQLRTQPTAQPTTQPTTQLTAQPTTRPAIQPSAPPAPTHPPASPSSRP